jgi:hypothetical protein
MANSREAYCKTEFWILRARAAPSQLIRAFCRLPCDVSNNLPLMGQGNTQKGDAYSQLYVENLRLLNNKRMVILKFSERYDCNLDEI